MMIKAIVSYLIFIVFIQGNVYAIELRDATLRDEDISATVLTVNYFTRADGLIEYVYTIKSPIENKGEIDGLFMDLSCNVDFAPIALPYADGKEGYMRSVQTSQPVHTPAAIHADYGSAAPYGITVNNMALWGVSVLPGKSTTGLRLISHVQPGMRTYAIKPWVDYSDDIWFFPEDESLVPDTVDFTITGMIAAPGCPGVTESPETVLYPGATFQVEPENINKLLQ
jgi:hypothetical protein